MSKHQPTTLITQAEALEYFGVSGKGSKGRTKAIIALSSIKLDNPFNSRKVYRYGDVVKLRDELIKPLHHQDSETTTQSA